MHFIELSDYTLPLPETGRGLNRFYFALSKGDVCSIRTDSPEDAHIFLRALATLERPEQGVYRFWGNNLNFSDYRELLFYKKKIGYIASDAALISNITIRENLLLMRSYFENSLLLTIDEKVAELCRIFALQDKLDLRPTEVKPLDLHSAIVIRELTKSPEVVLLEHPERFIGSAKFGLFVEILKDMLLSKLSVVFISDTKAFVEEFSNKKILITDGHLTTV